MASYPRNLSYFVKRLANYSRNTSKLQTLNTTSAGPSQIITVDLPNNSLVDLSTLVWYFEGTTNSTANSCTFPRNIETLIERVEVEINGQLVSPGCANYSQLWQIISDTTMGDDCRNRRRILQNASNVSAPSANVTTAVPFTICNWLGFLGSVQPTVLDTNLLGNVRIRITLASASVLVSSATAVTGASYALANMFFSVDTLSIDDGMYYAIHDGFLSKGGVYEIPFNNFYSFTQAVSSSGSGSVKFSLSTQSLNHLWATFAYGGTTPQVANTNAGTSLYFLRSACGISGYQFNINNTYVPNFRVDRNLAFNLLMNSYNLSQDTLGGIHPNIDTLAKWQNAFWVASCALDHPTAGDERFISGVNTLGSVAQGYWEYDNATVSGTPFDGNAGNAVALIFAQTTAVLQVGAGRQIGLVL